MNNTDKEFLHILTTGLKDYHIEVSDEQIKKLCLFNDMVMQTNAHTNLTAIDDGKESRITSYNVCYTKLLRIINGKNFNIIHFGNIQRNVTNSVSYYFYFHIIHHIN